MDALKTSSIVRKLAGGSQIFKRLRISKLGANSCNLLSPSLTVICGIFAAVFCNLRYIFVTASRSSRTRQGANPVEPQRWAGICKLLKLADCIIVTNVLPPEQAPLFAYSQLGHVVQLLFCVVQTHAPNRIGGPCPPAAFRGKPEVEAFQFSSSPDAVPTLG